MPRELINQRAAAKHMGFKEQTLANWRYQGRGPRYYKIAGGAIRYDVRDLDAFLEASAHDPTSQPQPAA